MLEFISYMKVLLEEGDRRKDKETCCMSIEIYNCFENDLVYFGLRINQNLKKACVYTHNVCVVGR